MAKVIYDIYKVTNDQSPVFGRHFGRVVHTETMDTEMLAQHIAEHGSPYTEDIVEGVLKKAEKCILEQLLDSKKVKLDGLGTFYLSAQNAKGGAESPDKFSVADNVQGVRFRFKPDSTDLDNLTSKTFGRKVSFGNGYYQTEIGEKAPKIPLAAYTPKP